jgi:uncharacterized protein YggU (UPF0235/DUF167 family)
MKVNVKVTPRASKTSIEYFDDQNLLKIKTTAAPVDGKANEEVIRLIAEYMDIPKSGINIATGLASKNIIVEINYPDVTKENLNKKPRLF